jgi:hypothetical protein
LISIYCLSGDQTNRIGINNFSPTKAAEDLEIPYTKFYPAFKSISIKFNWFFDEKARVLFIPSWWRWNPPESTKALQGYLNDLDEVAPSPLINRFLKNTTHLSDSLSDTLHTKAIGYTMAYQEQEQEQEQDIYMGVFEDRKDDFADTSIGQKPKSQGKYKPTPDNGYDPNFEKWWIEYPSRRKAGKPAVYEKWNKLKKAKVLPPISEMLKILQAQKKSQDWLKAGGEYIPGPLPYLNQSKFVDESLVLTGHDPMDSYLVKLAVRERGET